MKEMRICKNCEFVKIIVLIGRDYCDDGYACHHEDNLNQSLISGVFKTISSIEFCRSANGHCGAEGEKYSPRASDSTHHLGLAKELPSRPHRRPQKT